MSTPENKSSIALNNRRDEQYRKFVKLFDVKSSQNEETTNFSKKAHEDLCRNVGDWLNQTRVILGENVSILQTHNLRDSGIDIIVKFLQTDLKIGIQIKSYFDISEKDFSQKVDSQVLQSKRNQIYRLFVCFAGDLTNRSHFEKVRGKITELDQTEGSYCHMVPPENLYTIIKCVEQNRPPSEFFLFDIDAIYSFMQGMSQSLTDEHKSVTFRFEIHENKVGENRDGFRIKFKDIIERPDLQHLPETLLFLKTPLKIPSTLIDRIEMISEGSPRQIYENRELIISPHVPDILVEFSLFNDDGTPIYVLGSQKAEIPKESGTTTIRSEERNPLEFELEIANESSIPRKSIDLPLNINFQKGDAIELEKVASFLFHLKKAQRIEIA